MSQSSQPAEPNFVPADYSLIRKLGSGQTSHVYLTRHPRLGEVALKLPRAELHMRPILRRMFENEVQITLSINNTTERLRDEHVVRALEGYPTGERAFLSLEHCPGGTLDELLTSQTLELDYASHLILDVAKGLEYTHNRQVLHRDVKPANIFLADERAKLGDYGTGMFMTERTSERVGTAFYMAPEIFEGKPPSVQSDVYSLGILAYEVLTGSRPFTGDSYDELMLQHLTSVPKNIRSRRPEVSSNLSNVVARAMSRDQLRRYRSVREFIQAYGEVTGIIPRSEAKHKVKAGRATRKTGVKEPSRPSKTSGKSAPRKTKSDAKEDKGGLFGWFKKK